MNAMEVLYIALVMNPMCLSDSLVFTHVQIVLTMTECANHTCPKGLEVPDTHVLSQGAGGSRHPFHL